MKGYVPKQVYLIANLRYMPCAWVNKFTAEVGSVLMYPYFVILLHFKTEFLEYSCN